jgi:hypothetical protein
MGLGDSAYRTLGSREPGRLFRLAADERIRGVLAFTGPTPQIVCGVHRRLARRP